ncbi:MAG: hypothetical protein QNL04_05380 [SAR324 cluster bacterium]|nr:hypothetical protein [SAR324 cluster bacterium]
MKAVRVVAHWLEDENDKIIFDVVLDEENKVKDSHIFGYYIDDEEKYPFLCVENKLHLGPWFEFEDASEADELISPIQFPILGREIKLGTELTRVDPLKGGTEEYTYEVKEIIDQTKTS